MNPAVIRLHLIPLEADGSAACSELRQLTESMARGSDQAWSQFHRIYGPSMFRRLLARTRGDDDLAKEALQRAYLRIAKHVRPCESEIMFNSWLSTVARTALQDCWRRRRTFADLLTRKRQEPPELADPGAEDGLSHLLDGCLARLDAPDRELLNRKYFSDSSVQTIADEMNLSRKAVESRLTRARQALRAELLLALRHE